MRSLRIAFVSSHPSLRRYRRDASFIYRCENLALALSHQGHQTSLLHVTALLLRNDFDIVVFLRPRRSWIFDYVVNKLRARGVTMVGDADDLIFDPTCAKFRPSVRNNQTDEEKVRNEFISYASAMSKMDKVQFSTPELKRRYLDLHPGARSTVIPNAAHRTWHALPAGESSHRNISYLSGTRTHDSDFSIVAPVLKKLLDRHQDLTVRIIGPVSSGLDHERVEHLQKVRFSDYPELVRASHVCIAPLEDTPFNRCKSALKALEAGMMNVPTVASPIGDYSSFKVDGLLHANSSEEWESQLEIALDPHNHKQLSDGLRERTLAVANVDEFATAFLQFATDRA